MKIKNVLISQPKPETEKSPYFDIAKNYKVNLEFKQFIKVEGLTAADFRKQRIDITQYSCIIMNSKNAVDHYFRMAGEMRYTVPENNKYFCLTEAVALYLQKYIVYRKRKIFFAQQSIEELSEVIRKNKDEKFLFPCSDKHTDKITEYLEAHKINYSKCIFYKTVSSDMKNVPIKQFDLVLFFSPHGVQSLIDNFPNYEQGDQKIGVFGTTTYQSAIAKKLRVDLVAPMPKLPSMAMALEWFIRETNKNGVSPVPFVPEIIPVIVKAEKKDAPKTNKKKETQTVSSASSSSTTSKVVKKTSTAIVSKVAPKKKQEVKTKIKKQTPKKQAIQKVIKKKAVVSKSKSKIQKPSVKKSAKKVVTRPIKKAITTKNKAKAVSKKSNKPVVKKVTKKSVAKKVNKKPIAKKTAVKKPVKKIVKVIKKATPVKKSAPSKAKKVVKKKR
jgi:uroporphyrinogen-III synthase